MQLQITGDLNPDVTGIYTKDVEVDGHTSWIKGDAVIKWDADYWVLEIEIDEIVYSWKGGTDTYLGEYTSELNGTATVIVYNVATTDNSYVTVAEGNTYFLTKLNTIAWDEASDNDKAKALVQATQAIEQLNYIDEKLDEDQTTQFPRLNLDTPQAVKDAICEIAIRYLDGIDIESEIEALQIVNEKISNMSATKTVKVPEHLMAGIVSYRAWVLLRPYLRDSRNLRLERVS